ncbi:MAG: biotin transporter BioY [Candidatus Zixiibacteriota bacterium]
MSLVSIFIVLTSVGALISIPIFAVPITMQVAIVLLSGFMLGSRLGFWTQLGYIALGLLGLPIFSAARGGLGIIISPTFGYLLGFPIAAFTVGFLKEKFEVKKLLHIVLIFTIALIWIYLFGFIYIWIFSEIIIGKDLSFIRALQISVLPFIAFDLAKIILTSLIAKSLMPLTDRLKT